MSTFCAARNRDGKPCLAHVRDGSDYCQWHDPQLAEERAAWNRKGGKHRSNKARARKALSDAVMTPSELLGSLSQAVRRLELGELEPGVAQAMAGVARAITEIRKSAEIDERLAELERRNGVVRLDDRRTA